MWCPLETRYKQLFQARHALLCHGVGRGKTKRTGYVMPCPDTLARRVNCEESTEATARNRRLTFVRFMGERLSQAFRKQFMRQNRKHPRSRKHLPYTAYSEGFSHTLQYIAGCFPVAFSGVGREPLPRPTCIDDVGSHLADDPHQTLNHLTHGTAHPPWYSPAIAYVSEVRQYGRCFRNQG